LSSTKLDPLCWLMHYTSNQTKPQIQIQVWYIQFSLWKCKHVISTQKYSHLSASASYFWFARS